MEAKDESEEIQLVEILSSSDESDEGKSPEKIKTDCIRDYEIVEILSDDD